MNLFPFNATRNKLYMNHFVAFMENTICDRRLMDVPPQLSQLLQDYLAAKWAIEWTAHIICIVISD